MIESLHVSTSSNFSQTKFPLSQPATIQNRTNAMYTRVCSYCARFQINFIALFSKLDNTSPRIYVEEKRRPVNYESVVDPNGSRDDGIMGFRNLMFLTRSISAGYLTSDVITSRDSLKIVRREMFLCCVTVVRGLTVLNERSSESNQR